MVKMFLPFASYVSVFPLDMYAREVGVADSLRLSSVWSGASRLVVSCLCRDLKGTMIQSRKSENRRREGQTTQQGLGGPWKRQSCSCGSCIWGGAKRYTVMVIAFGNDMQRRRGRKWMKWMVMDGRLEETRIVFDLEARGEH